MKTVNEQEQTLILSLLDGAELDEDLYEFDAKAVQTGLVARLSATSDVDLVRGLVAIPFGKDHVNGDSMFYPTEECASPYGIYEVDSVTTFESLELEFGRRYTEYEGEEPEDEDEPAGYWVLRPEDVKTALLPGQYVEPTRDSEVYNLNHVIKCLCRELAQYTITQE